MFTQLDRWHQTKTGLLVFGLVELILAYGAISWAVDSGRLLAWSLSIILLVGALHDLVKIIRKVIPHGNRA